MSHMSSIGQRMGMAALTLLGAMSAVAQAPPAPPPTPVVDPATEARAKQLFADAVQAQQSAQYATAITSYERVLAIKPRSASTLNNLAQAYAAMNDVDRALQYSQQAADIGGADQPFYQRQYADLLARTNRDQAIAVYRTLVSAGATDARSALTALYASGPSAELAPYLWELIDAGEVLTAADTALDALGRGGAGNVDLLTVVVRSLAHPTLSAEQSAALRARLAAFTGNSTIADGIREVLRLYEAADGSFSWWAGRGRPWEDPPVGIWPVDAFRMLVRALGAQAEQVEDVARAEAYYLRAAELRQDELDPLAFQALCKLYMRRNDIGKLQSIVNNPNYIGQLFSDKNAGYRLGQRAKIYEYHVTLGYIYGSLARQNVIGWGDSNTPASAVFQLERAMTVGAAIDAQPTAARSQAHVDLGVVELLATYYDQQNRAPAAAALRADASRRLTSVGDTRGAEEVLRQRSLNVVPRTQPPAEPPPNIVPLPPTGPEVEIVRPDAQVVPPEPERINPRAVRPAAPQR
jgi:tetratricopeptide (TPR) repeat protein